MAETCDDPYCDTDAVWGLALFADWLNRSFQHTDPRHARRLIV